MRSLGIAFAFASAMGLKMWPGATLAQPALSPYSSAILQREGLVLHFIAGPPDVQILVGPDSRADRRIIIAHCEDVLEENRRVVERQFGYEAAIGKATGIVATAADMLAKARQSQQGLAKLRAEAAKFKHDYSGSGKMLNCTLSKALEMVGGGVSAAQTPLDRRTATPPVAPARIASSPQGMPPTPAMRSIDGTTVRGITKALGPQGNAALDKVMLPGPEIAPELVMAQRRAAQSQSERAGFQKMRTRTLHNRANDATACLKVEKTGVTTEWGIEGRYRLVNNCGYPVEASWCANPGECSSGRGNLWTIRAGGDYPIFSGDPTNPEIQVGGCKAGAAKEAPLAQQPGINQTGVNETRDAPVPAPGVSLLTNHRCE